MSYGVHMRVGRPLLSAHGRIWAGALLACGAILISVLGALFAHQAQADRFDHAIDAPIINWLGGHRTLALWLAFPGTLIPAVVLSAVIVVACILTGRLNGALLAATAVLAAAGLNDGLLKDLVHRTYLGALTYPSGHTATIFALAATVEHTFPGPRPAGGLGALRVVIPVVVCLLGGVVAERRHRPALALFHRYRGRRGLGHRNRLRARPAARPAGGQALAHPGQPPAGRPGTAAQ